MEGNPIAKRFQEICKEKNMTYQMVSELACMPINRVYRIYNGITSNPSVFAMIDICEALGVTLDEFFGTEEFKNMER